jgi:hypothetical protein
MLPLQSLAQLARGPHVGARRDADQQPQVAAQLPCGFDGVVVGHLDHLVDQRHIEYGGDEAVADALDLMQPGLVAQQGGHILRLDGHQVHVGFMLAEKLAHALQRAAAAHTGHETIDFAADLPPDLVGRVFVVAARVVGVFELLRHEDARIGRGHLGHPPDGAGDAFPIGREDQFRSERADDLLAFLAHALGHDDLHLVALQAADQRDADARVATGRFDDDRVGFQASVAFRPFEHGQGHAVLDRAARVQELGFGENRLRAQADSGVLPIRSRMFAASMENTAPREIHDMVVATFARTWMQLRGGKRSYASTLANDCYVPTFWRT